MSSQCGLRAIIAARLSKLQKNGVPGIGIDTQDLRSREYCDREGIEVVALVADTKSGTVAPWDRKHLKPWVTDPQRMMLYDTIVAFKTDRLSRGTQEDFTRIEMWATEHQKRLIIVDGPQYPARDDSDYWQWAAEKRTARKEWEAGQERTVRALHMIESRGMLTGRPPFGYTSEGEKYSRHMVPTDIGRKYVPQIFARIADGQPAMTVCRWLDSEGVRPNSRTGASWSPKSVTQMIRRRTYAGQRQNAEGRTITEVEPLVDAKLWTAANKRLDETTRGRRGPATHPPALLTGALKCGRCGSSMYRIQSSGTVPFYYRCNGRPPLRKGCGMMVPITLLDDLVDEAMSENHLWIMEATLVPGQNYDVQIEAIRLKIRDLGAADLGDDEYDARLAGLRSERDELRGLESTPDRWETRATSVTYAQQWTASDLAGRREMLSLTRVTFSWDGEGEDRLPIVTIDPLYTPGS
jgi:DNA invertase Pin-like site-specific DNA recombinase